jgi:hypothetical protein
MKPSESNPYSRDAEVQERLWREGEAMVGASFTSG